MVVAYGREAEHWDEMERPFIQQAHLFRGIAARRASTKRLAELDKQRCKLPVTLHTGPTLAVAIGRAPWCSATIEMTGTAVDRRCWIQRDLKLTT